MRLFGDHSSSRVKPVQPALEVAEQLVPLSGRRAVEFFLDQLSELLLAAAVASLMCRPSLRVRFGYVEGGACRLVSRNGDEFKAFPTLAASIGQDLAGRAAILDGEIVRPGDGRPLFYELIGRRGPFCFYAFDLMWLDARDLQAWPLAERKAELARLLRKLLPRPSRVVLYVEYVASGTELFREICARDMEGIVAKQARGLYTPEATTWVKIKNRTYS
jgi:ATP-dependent DNA ligase